MVWYRAECEIELEGKEECRAEDHLPVSLAYLLLWLVGSQGMSAGVRGWDTRINMEECWRRTACSPLEMGAERKWQLQQLQILR